MTIRIETERLILRPLAPEDCENPGPPVAFGVIESPPRSTGPRLNASRRAGVLASGCSNAS